MSEHLERQNWFAVALDLFTVVLGVYLGFQVTTWNEQRSERALEAEYLKRIHGELVDAKAALERILRDAETSRLHTPELSGFLDGRAAKPDPQRLVVAIVEFGLDPIDVNFDLSTFNDLVSTGRLRLISDPTVRRGIQRAYAELQNYAPFRNPYRDEYKFALSGLVPTSISQQVRQACPGVSAYPDCKGLALDGDATRVIMDQIDRREAMLAFNTRDQGLRSLIGKGRGILKVLDETVALLERQPVR